MGKGKTKQAQLAEPAEPAEPTLREQVDVILAEFGDAWLGDEDGWWHIKPHEQSMANPPKKLICVGVKVKNPGWSAARWYWRIGTTKGEVEGWVKRAEEIGALEVKVRVADEIEWVDQV